MAAPTQLNRNLQKALKASADKAYRSQRRELRGTTVGQIRAITWPEAPAQSAPPPDTVLVHVVDVRLIDDPDRSIVRDVLIGTQARELIASGALDILEEGTPVSLEYDQNGQLQVTGRIQIAAATLSIDVYELGDFGLPYTWGLECQKFSELTTEQQDDINDARVANGQPALDPDKQFSALTDAEILDLFGLDITEYNDERAAEDPPLAPVTAQEAVNIEREEKGLVPLPDTYLAMDVCIYIDYFDAIAVGTPTYNIPGQGRFTGSVAPQKTRSQIVQTLLYGSPEFTYGEATYGETFITYTV